MKMPHPAKAEQGTPSNGANPTIRLALAPARSSAITEAAARAWANVKAAEQASQLEQQQGAFLEIAEEVA